MLHESHCTHQAARWSAQLAVLRLLPSLEQGRRDSRRQITCSLRCASTVAEPLLTTEEAKADRNNVGGRKQTQPIATFDTPEIVEESSHLLEWPAICKQVAAFASTSIAAREILQNGLHLGRSQEESEVLLQQTADAQRVDLGFENVFNLHPVIAAAQEGQALNARHLNAVASTLEAADALKSVLGIQSAARNRQAEASTSAGHPTGSREYPSLVAVMQPAAEGAPSLLAAIRHCIGQESGIVLDRSSAELAEVRRRRQQNSARLHSEVEKWARQLFTQKASENAQVMVQRGRLCVSVRAGRQGELPKGSVKMGASRSGATLYMEPAPLVDLNNAESRLEAEEKECEQAVLRHLTEGVAGQSHQLLKVMRAILELDTINARAQHGLWLSAARPTFHSRSPSRGSVELQGARHPLLLQKYLPSLPPLVEVDDAEFDTGFLGRVTALQTAEDGFADGAGPSGASGSETIELPKPVDLTVPPEKASVILTGPNTGGKTASLKTLGVLTLMAKAGLFLPLEGGKAGMEWFDKVLADVGDSQDLTQNLSTFSGHVHRLKRITAAVGPQSLVLLDELGSGTDPVEGGALAAVLLEWLLPRARLTVCTSHHAELKELSAGNEAFVNASVEFDSKTLLPTYHLLWGTPGESQALAVAEGLGFDQDIVKEARGIAEAATFASRPGQHAGQLKDSLAGEVEEARGQTTLAAKQREAAEEKLAALEKQVAELEAKQQAIQGTGKQGMEQRVAAAARKTQRMLDDFARDSLSLEAARKQLLQLREEALQQRRATALLFGREEGESNRYMPRNGDLVKLLSMGGAHARVVKASGNSGKLTVRVGKVAAEVNANDVVGVETDSSRTNRPKNNRKKKKQSPGRDSQAAAVDMGGSRKEVLRVQIPENTVDLRGLRELEAIQELERGLDACPADSVLFVIHGHGSGRIKAAVREYLRHSSVVERISDEPNSAGGCTVVEFR